jgi:TfoX/Sxy family transcriptional regulator of competence genes
MPTPPKKRPAVPARKWKPASTEWVKVYTEVATGLGEPRKMFGYPCSFVNGNMFAGLFQTGLFLRLSEPDRVKFLKLPGAKQFEPLPGRPMREYVTAPAEMSHQPGLVAKWLSRAFTYGSSLHPKARKAGRK